MRFTVSSLLLCVLEAFLNQCLLFALPSSQSAQIIQTGSRVHVCFSVLNCVPSQFADTLRENAPLM